MSVVPEKNRPKVGVGVLVVKEGKVLFGKRKGAHGAGEWSLAGGHLEFGETIEECARRELLEETGLKAGDISVGPWTSDIMAGNKHYITFFALVKNFEGEPSLLEPQKCEGWQWFDWDQLPDPLFPPVISLIKGFSLDKLKRFYENPGSKDWSSPAE